MCVCGGKSTGLLLEVESQEKAKRMSALVSDNGAGASCARRASHHPTGAVTGLAEKAVPTKDTGP